MKRTLEVFISTLFLCTAHIVYADHIVLGEGKLSTCLITTSAQDATGYIWIGTEYGLNRFDGFDLIEYYTKENDSKSLADNNIRDIYTDRYGKLWIATSRGMQMYDNIYDTFVNINFEGCTEEADVFQITELMSGRMLAVVSGEGIFEISTDSRTASPYTSIKDLCGTDSIRHIYEDKEHRLWILSVNDGIFRINRNHTDAVSYRLHTTASVSSATMAETHNGTLIAIINGSPWYLDKDDDAFKPVICQEDSNFTAYDLLKRSNGDFLISTSYHGLLKLDEENCTLKDYHTDYPHGSDDKSLRIVSMMEDRENNLWLGCMNSGVIMIPYNRSSGVTDKSPVLTNLYINSESARLADIVDSDGNIRLDQDQNTLTFAFSTMSIRNAENISFRYRLKGLDKKWYSTRAGENKITYNHIPSGRYTMEVYALKDSAISSVFRQKITIGHTWYRKVIYYSALACVLISIVMIIITGIFRRRRAEENEKKISYYSKIANEISSPILMIMNPIESLLEKESNPETINILNTVRRNCIRLMRLMNNFLDTEKLEKGEMTVDLRKSDIIKTVNGTLETFAYEAQKRKINIDFEYPYDSMVLDIDPEIIDNIIFNLVGASMKKTPDGGEVKLTISLSEEYGRINIIIEDSGLSLNSDDDKQLNLCRMMAYLHNATLTSGKRHDRSGNIFTLCLSTSPFELQFSGNNDTDSENSRSIRITESAQTYKPAKKARVKNSERILIIEDDIETLNYLEDILSPLYKIITAKDGNSGMKLALTEMPDLIISKMVLPDIDALHLVKRIKNNSNTMHIPVILLGSKVNENEEIDSLEQGADEYIAKPFNTSVLEARIENILDNRKRVKGKYSGAHQEDKIKTIEVESNDEKLMSRIMVAVNDNLDNPELNVEMLASEIGLSRAQLHRKMKEITGNSTGEFIRNIRLKKAAELLNEQKVNISQVAYIVGFSSQTHFSTVFRKFYGITPTEYINSRNVRK